MVHFPGTDYRQHTSCITEDQKYQGALYKSKKQKSNEAQPINPPHAMAHNAYVEDVTEEYEAYRDYEIRESDVDDGQLTGDLPPEAPTPPSAVAPEANLNVFDFLVSATPTASQMNLQDYIPVMPTTGGRQLVRFDQEAADYVDPAGYMVDDEEMMQYGAGPIQYAEYATPAPKASRKKTKETGREVKKDKKRKRLHIDTHIETPAPLTEAAPGDEVMTDAPPVLHSGLTGGLNRLMRPNQFPPSPDYSGGDGAENSPASPLKKTKHSKHPKHPKPSRSDSFGTNLKALMSGSSKTKVSKKRKHSSEKKDKKRRHTHKRVEGAKAPKLIEYRPKSSDEKEGEKGTMVVYKPRSDLFLSFCNKGPDSERGCSVNKALKRFHRERDSSGDSLGKVTEEKELWRSLRMRRNERGEIVLFSIADGDA
ncbi:hypothetical protein F4778DRAFT_208829 [Xylariomycetidae sp. FL2044]|nr:hypothetical protein F4778DRAFT_208829 [Xylariomycetidae sp. FL2044]